MPPKKGILKKVRSNQVEGSVALTPHLKLNNNPAGLQGDIRFAKDDARRKWPGADPAQVERMRAEFRIAQEAAGKPELRYFLGERNYEPARVKELISLNDAARERYQQELIVSIFQTGDEADARVLNKLVPGHQKALDAQAEAEADQFLFLTKMSNRTELENQGEFDKLMLVIGGAWPLYCYNHIMQAFMRAINGGNWFPNFAPDLISQYFDAGDPAVMHLEQYGINHPWYKAAGTPGDPVQKILVYLASRVVHLFGQFRRGKVDSYANGARRVMPHYDTSGNAEQLQKTAWLYCARFTPEDLAANTIFMLDKGGDRAKNQFPQYAINATPATDVGTVNARGAGYGIYNAQRGFFAP